MSYRLDIEGLRALAVLLVVIFHINETLITGGFVGVDLFFVISGYVITQRIYKDGLNKPGAFYEFYRRRIRRITPVMLCVTAATLVAGAFILLPSDLVELSWSALAASLSAANIYYTFFLDTSYFAKDSHYIPLLHLWSLGVEEQFYFIWPLLLFILMKWPRAILPVLAAIMIISIAWGEYWIRTDNFTVAYYMLPSRAFQLCAGGFCLFAAQTKPIKNIPTSFLLIMGLIGLILVLGNAFYLTGQMAFPGLNAVPITVGACLLLIAGTKEHILSRALSIWPMRKIGGISYSMYLWHWPILAYLRYAYIDIDFQTGATVFLAIIALSMFSTEFIEKPFRYSTLPFSKIFNRMFLAPTLVLGVFCATLVSTKGFITLVDPQNYINKLASASNNTEAAYKFREICQVPRLKEHHSNRPECLINGEGTTKVLLWGDSHAAHYVGVVKSLAVQANASFRNIAHSACPPLLDKPERYSSKKYAESCSISNALVRTMISNYDHVILSGAYSSYQKFSQEFENEIKKTIFELTSAGKKVTILGQTMYFNNYDRNCFAKSLKLPIDCMTAPQPNFDEIQNINTRLSLIAKTLDVDYYDFNQFICPNNVCSPYLDGQPIYYDEDHLSMYGSLKIGEIANKTSDYERFFINDDVSMKP